MAKYTFIRYIITLLLFLAISNISVSQEMMYEVKLSDQVERSNQIVEGKVISKQSFWDDSHENIYTAHTIEVYKVFKGQPTATIEVITKGGIVDLEAQVVSSSLKLRNGDIGVFTLSDKLPNMSSQSHNRAVFKSVSDSQGFYKYNLDLDMAVNTFKSIEGITTQFYNEVTQNTNLNIIEVKALNINDEILQAKSSLSRTSSSKIFAPAIASFNTTNSSAGTKSVLTINGSGFGSEQGTVGFSDADYGGYIHSDALDNQIRTWTETKIEVEIPDLAGTGTFKVNTVTNGSIISSNPIIIDFAQINLNYNAGSGDVAYQTQHVDNNDNGGNTWTMNQAFFNSGAKDAFTRAFEKWTCSTGVNWVISNTTSSINKNANDGISIITFDDTMGGGTLGQCYSRYKGCYDQVAGDIKWYVTEMDIVFNTNQNWNFSIAPPANNQVDFETVTVHELGHGHQLGHVVDTNVVMHYSISSGESLRDLGTDDLMGAVDVQTRSTSTTVCSQLSMTASSCYQASLGTDDFQVEDAISVFPNPTSSNVFVKVKSGLNIEKIAIYNLEGRQVYYSLERNNNTLKSINTSAYANGVYLMRIQTDFGTISKKLIIN